MYNNDETGVGENCSFTKILFPLFYFIFFQSNLTILLIAVIFFSILQDRSRYESVAYIDILHTLMYCLGHFNVTQILLKTIYKSLVGRSKNAG